MNHERMRSERGLSWDTIFRRSFGAPASIAAFQFLLVFIISSIGGDGKTFSNLTVQLYLAIALACISLGCHYVIVHKGIPGRFLLGLYLATTVIQVVVWKLTPWLTE